MRREGPAPLFSVVVPVYNARDNLPDSLGSVFTQDFDDYEVVLVDDGSTDGSAALCDEYASCRGNVVVTHLENGGSLLARHEGFAISRGEYVVCLDSDDRFRDDALSTLACVIDEDRPDLVLFRFSLSEGFAPYAPSALDLDPGPHGEADLGRLRRIICTAQHTNSLWSKAFRREVLDAGADYSSFRGLIHGDDLLQVLNVLDGVRSFHYCPEALYYYRPNPASVTRSYRSGQLDDLMVVIDSLLSHADAWGDGCPEAARRGAILQCIYLLHILMGDSMADDCRRAEFERLARYMDDAGLFGEWQRFLRIDKRLEARALHRADYAGARLLSRLAGLLKRTRDGVAAR